MAELLSIPWKKSSDVELVKPLRNLLQATHEGSEDWADALAELARLRNDAIWKIFDKSSLDVIYCYYDQLVSLEGKVPPQEVQIPFKWKDAFDRGSIFGGRMSLTVSSLAYERVCVLFNIGALQSMLAAQQPLDTEDSLKLAAKLLQQAAGVFLELKTSVLAAVHQEPTPDLQPDTLHACAALMLAQAQEVIAYKCIRDEMKESMVARVCAQCEELYADAARLMARDPQRALWDRDWPALVHAKQQAFRGLAQLYQSLACRAAGAVGEEIARLRLAVEQLRAAAARLPQAPLLGDQLTRATRHLAEATKDNDFIYHERVPEPRELEPVARAAVAKPLGVPARWSAGRDLFAALLPAAAHRALAAAHARRADAVAQEVNGLRDATQLLNSILASLNLPACVEQAQGEELPESIRARAAAVRAGGGGAALRALMEDLPQLLQRNRDILDEAERMLREEEEADAALRAQFGARWGRTPSPQLTEAFRANAAKYRQIIDNAVRADAIVQQKFAQHKDDIELLGRSDGEITAGVPEAAGAGAGAGAEGADAAAELRALMGRVERLKSDRDALEQELKDVTLDLKEQFLGALAADGAVDEPALTAGALGAALAPLQRRAGALAGEQERVVGCIQTAHARLAAAGGGGGVRGAALGRLCAAHDAYADLTANLTEGVKFYNDLTQLLVTFQNKISDFCFARRTEKEELLKDLTQDASRVQRPAPAPPQQPQQPQPAQEPTVVATKKDPPPRPPPPAAAPAPAAAALPYPMQPQGMPLPYGAPYGYYAAPLPATYNPYATLPYPHHAPRLPAQPYQPYQHPPAPPGYPAPPQHGYNPYPPPQ